MADLPATLAEVRKRIARYRDQGINEQNTKAVLIDPVLRALDWDLEELEEVKREYKRKPQDKPVDYALFALRKPRLFIEAKALGKNLDDRRWANQIMGYAAVAGAEWVVLTDGNEYRIYNSHALVPVEDKVFRIVRITDEDTSDRDTLHLLSKERLEENRLQVLWNAHFVDRNVRLAIEGMFAADPDPALVRLVRKKTESLSPKQIRASLSRSRINLDFPVEPETAPPGAARSPRRTQPRPRQRPAPSRVSLQQLIEAGLLRPPFKLEYRYKGHDLSATVQPDGSVTFQGQAFSSLSSAGGMARKSIVGAPPNRKYPPTNGWTFWRYRDEQGQLHMIDALRQQFLREAG